MNPYLINFPKIGSSEIGYISLAEKKTLPFVPKRVYWTYFTPEDVERGNHAHFELEQILIAVSGKVIVTIEPLIGDLQEFVLDSPKVGLFIPKLCWRKLKYTHNAVQVCLASLDYTEEDYIRNYDNFKRLRDAV